MARMGKKHRHTVLVDEHIHDWVAAVFEEYGFRVLRASRDSKYHGRDEWDYFGELRRDNIVFVTQDARFVQRLTLEAVRHGGVISLPKGWPKEADIAVHAAAGMLLGALDQGSKGAHDTVIRIADDGLYTIVGGREQLAWSVDQMERDIEEEHGRRNLRG
jgi:hypothetical protein